MTSLLECLLKWPYVWLKLCEIVASAQTGFNEFMQRVEGKEPIKICLATNCFV